MASKATIEPLPAQINDVANLEQRARRLIQDIEDLEEAIEATSVGPERARDNGELGGAAWSIWLLCAEPLKALRITGGRRGFLDWWALRLQQGYSLDDLRSHNVVSEARRRVVKAVEAQVIAADPGLAAPLSRLSCEDKLDDASYMKRAIGLTYDELHSRAEAAVTKLIASGWRP